MKKVFQQPREFVKFIVIILTLCFCVSVTTTKAATFTVNSGADSNDATPGNGVCADLSGNCTLRAAVEEANALASADAINFDAALTGQTISIGAGGEITIANNGALTINGLAANALTISGNNLSRIFFVNAGATAVIRNLAIANGRVIGANGANGANGSDGSGGGDGEVGGFGDPAIGGGIVNHGILSLSGVAVRNNQVTGGTGGRGGNGGSGIFSSGGVGGVGGVGGTASGGGIYNTGTLYLLDSTISGNQTTGGNGGSGGSGGIGVGGTAGGGGGGWGGGAEGNIYNNGTLYAANSTVTDNQTTRGSGGSGGTGNPNGGAGLNGFGGGGGFHNLSTLELRNATISTNSVIGEGGGIFNLGTVNFGNTVVADNIASAIAGRDIFGTVNSLGHNLIENVGGASVTGVTTGNQTGVDPQLGSLQNNGGGTATRALTAGSAAINTGNNALAVNPANSQALGSDQRGYQRIVNSTVDIGAVEFGAAISCLSVSLPSNVPAGEDMNLTVPVNVSETTSAGIISYDFTLTYDPSVLVPQAIAVDKTGTLSNNFEVNAGTGTPGQIVVSAFGAAPLSGAGTLLNLKFTVIGTAPAFSSLNFTAFGFNEGTPCSNTTNGSVSVQGTISGTISYGTSSTPQTVPGVNLLAVGSPNVSTVSDLSGAYTLTGFGAGQYTVTPVKTGDNNGITAFDASLVSQFLIGTAVLSANQQAAADVSGNGTISSFDAARIAQYVVRGPNQTIPGNAGIWQFIPVSRAYPNVGTETDQNYTAILIGEVSGNWASQQPGATGNRQGPANSAANAPTVSLPSVEALPDQPLTVPVSVNNLSESVAAYQFDLLYDARVLQPQNLPATTAGTLSDGMSVVANAGNAGLLRVAVYGTQTIRRNGVLLNLQFQVIGTAGSSSLLRWQNLILNEGAPAVNAADGRVSVRNQTARAPFDFDGDGRSDVSVFRPSDRIWYLNRSQAGFSAVQFGLPADRITPADFDGDHQTDISVYRDGVWYWLNSSDGNFNAVQFGLAGDIPQPADFDGDGRAELTVYRRGQWWMFNLGTNQVSTVQFGISSDKPVVADYDGDGKADHAVYRNGEWHLNQSTRGYAVVNFGLAADQPVIGDYDGDGKTDPAVYRAGVWYVLQSGQGFTAFHWGVPTDIPAPADYDGDGKTDAAVYRDGTWYLLQSTGGISIQQFGLANDKPVPAGYLP